MKIKILLVIFSITLIAVLAIFIGGNTLLNIDVILNVNLDKDSYKSGEIVNIIIELKKIKTIFRGIVLEENPLKGKDIAIQILNPDKITVYVDQSQTDRDGKTFFKVKINNMWKTGIYTIHIVTSGKHIIKTFKVEKTNTNNS